MCFFIYNYYKLFYLVNHDGTKMKYISYLNMGKKEKLITHWRSVFLIWYGVQQIVDALVYNKIFSVL